MTESRALMAFAAVTVFGTAYGQANLEYAEWYAFCHAPTPCRYSGGPGPVKADWIISATLVCSV